MRKTIALPLGGAAAVLVTSLAFAQDAVPEQRDPGGAVQADDGSRALKRILHMRGGGTLRGVTRLTGAAWEIKQSGGWRPLPPESVETVALEKDVVREMKRKKKDVAKDDARGRAGLSAWMITAGLVNEGIAELDDVLDLDPDCAPALEVVASNAYRIRMPAFHEPAGDASSEEYPKTYEAALDPLARWAAAAGNAGKEMAVKRLADAGRRDALRGALLSALHASTSGKRTFAALALRRLFTGDAVKPLLVRAVLDAAEPVRRHAALALRDVGEPGLVVPVVNAMNKSVSEKVRMQAEEALGNMGYAVAVPALMARLSLAQSAGGYRTPRANIFIGEQFAYIQDFDVEVAQFQAVADPEINVLVRGQVTEAGVHSIGHAYFTGESRVIRTALGKLTGAEPGRRNVDWREWWETNRGEWLRRAPATSDG